MNLPQKIAAPASVRTSHKCLLAEDHAGLPCQSIKS